MIEALRSTPSSRVVNAKGENLLTAREEQVVNLVAEGIGNREIGQQLGVRENTVKKSLLRIYDKLGVSNRVELVLYAITHRRPESSLPSARRLAVPAPVAFDCVEPSQMSMAGADCGPIPKAG
ncbi:MAG TPA: LuxR C-terminal-related transcriptional regulator [Terriglobales bacterium]|nr:LuxR C-terminal-related transcriptional regulator [Terriglobales bacterium]